MAGHFNSIFIHAEIKKKNHIYSRCCRHLHLQIFFFISCYQNKRKMLEFGSYRSFRTNKKRKNFQEKVKKCERNVFLVRNNVNELHFVAILAHFCLFRLIPLFYTVSFEMFLFIQLFYFFMRG